MGEGRERERTCENLTCSRRNSYFDPSVGSDWASLMSICLAGISLAPGNPTGFLRVGGGFEGSLIRGLALQTLVGSKQDA